jgi:hypothetical protein
LNGTWSDGRQIDPAILSGLRSFDEYSLRFLKAYAAVLLHIRDPLKHCIGAFRPLNSENACTSNNHTLANVEPTHRRQTVQAEIDLRGYTGIRNYASDRADFRQQIRSRFIHAKNAKISFFKKPNYAAQNTIIASGYNFS